MQTPVPIRAETLDYERGVSRPLPAVFRAFAVFILISGGADLAQRITQISATGGWSSHLLSYIFRGGFVNAASNESFSFDMLKVVAGSICLAGKRPWGLIFAWAFLQIIEAILRAFFLLQIYGVAFSRGSYPHARIAAFIFFSFCQASILPILVIVMLRRPDIRARLSDNQPASLGSGTRPGLLDSFSFLRSAAGRATAFSDSRLG